MNENETLVQQFKLAAGGRVSNEGLDHALEVLEREMPIGALLSTVAAPDFRSTMFDAAKGRPQAEALAWLTVAASGMYRARRVLARRAVQIVDPDTLVDLLVVGSPAGECAKQAEAASTEDGWGAWLLLGRLRRSELRKAVRARPSLKQRLKQAAQQAKRPINPQLHHQLRDLGLVPSMTSAVTP